MARSDLVVLIRRCLHQRTTPREFSQLLDLYLTKQNFSSVSIVAALLKAITGFCLDNDPLVSKYLQVLLISKHILTSECLLTLIKYWQASGRSRPLEDLSSGRLVAQIITSLTLTLTQISSSSSEARSSIILSSRWLQSLFSCAASQAEKGNNEQISMLVNVLVAFLLTTLNTTAGLAAVRLVEDSREDALNVAVRQVIHSSISTFPHLYMQLLSEAQKYPSLDESPETDINNAQVAEMAAMTFENDIPISQIVPNRTATYVLLYTKLLHSDTIDDNALLSFLDTRYSSNTALIFNDLLFSSFDALTKPVQATEPMYQAQCRIYLHNKLPAILATITSPIQALPTEQYLHELWNEISTSADDRVVVITKHFLHICVLHHLISADTVENLTAEGPESTSAKGLFQKDALVSQVKANASRGPRLIDELAKNDGNAGSFSLAVVEIIHRYCLAKETQHLKDMSNALVKQPGTINALAMFVHSAYFLSPLCRLLDDWSWSDIHGESQPIYEEFGSVLLLVATFKSRLGLRSDQLGLSSQTGFVAQYLSSGQSEKLVSNLTDSEKVNLGDWIHNLYESEGISDEVTSNCSAKEFYQNFPTLLRQSMTALSRGTLTQERLEGGLDYLLEPFLLPSLLSAFAWLARNVTKDVRSSVVILRRLSKPPENPDTRKLHRTILDIAHSIFTDVLTQEQDPNQYAEIFAMLGNPLPFTVKNRQRKVGSPSTGQNTGDVANLLQSSFAQTQSVALVPATSELHLYQPDFLLIAATLRGPTTIVSEMITLLVRYASSHEFPYLLDIVSIIIVCTPMPNISLRTSLQLFHAKLGILLRKGENLFAQALVHLSRRVELYAATLLAQSGSEIHDLGDVTGVDLAEINLDQIPQKIEMPEQQNLPIPQLDPLVGENIDQILTDAASLGSMNEYDINDESMFDLDNYDLTNIDDLDMSMF